MTRIKICGISNVTDAQLAAELGADALGFVFFRKSPRSVTPEQARYIIAQLPPFVLTVGVFVNDEAAAVRDIASRVGLDWLQLHGEESPDYCGSLGRRVIKAFRLKEGEGLPQFGAYQGAVQAFLLDAYRPGVPGGTGATFNWELARQAAQYGPIILAGGLTPDNAARAVAAARPQAVDVASGVEAAPGKKDPEKLRRFFAALRR